MLIDENEFGSWLNNRELGEVVYFRPDPKFIGRDRESLAGECAHEATPGSQSKAHILVRDMAWAAQEAGRVCLVQRRRDGAIEYVAQKRCAA